MQNIALQRSFGAVAQGHALPSFRRLLVHPPVDSDRRRLRLAAGGWTTPPRGRWWHDRLRIVQVDPLVFVNIADEDLALVVARPQECRIASIEAIEAHPRKTNGLLPSVGNQFQRQVVLALEDRVWHRNTRGFTALRVSRPGCGQK